MNPSRLQKLLEDFQDDALTEDVQVDSFLPLYNPVRDDAVLVKQKLLRRLVCIGNHLGYYPGNFFPQDAGLDYQISPTLQPVQRHRDDFTVFSNLDDGTSGGHKGVHAFLSGIRKEESAGFPEKNMTLDQAAAEHVGSATRYASLTTGLGEGTNLSWTRSGVNIPPVNNPAILFQALFVD